MPDNLFPEEYDNDEEYLDDEDNEGTEEENTEDDEEEMWIRDSIWKQSDSH